MTAAEYHHSPVRQPPADSDNRLVIGAREIELRRIQPVGAPVQWQSRRQPPQIARDKRSRWIEHRAESNPVQVMGDAGIDRP